MLATLFTCSLVLTSCKDDDADPGESPLPPSTVDNGTWPVDDNNMDLSVKPGDNFFMYCNGSWWNSATVPTTGEPYEQETGFFADHEKAFNKLYDQQPNAVRDKINAHINDIDKTTADAVKTYQAMVDAVALDKATTKEEVCKAIARHANLGGSILFEFDTFNKDGKICLCIYPTSPEYFSDTKEAQVPASDPLEDAQFLKSLVPLTGEGTRTVNDGSWPLMAAIVKEMGIDPSLVYVPKEVFDLMSSKDAQVDPTTLTKSLALLGYESIESVEEFKKLAQTYIVSDSSLVSTQAMEIFNKRLEKEVDEITNRYRVLSKKSFQYIPSCIYMNYLNSKVMVENMVTPAMKQHGQEIVDECKAVFKERINASTWLSDGSKTKVIDKLDNIISNVGGPDRWYTEGLPDVSQSKSLLEDVYTLRKAYLALIKTLVGKPVKEASFHTMNVGPYATPLTMANAFYSNTYNSINIFPFFLRAPFYVEGQNSAMNYLVYNIIGHEITHGFDTNGSQLDKNGSYGPIFENQEDGNEFDRRAKSLISWFAGFYLLPDELPGVQANADNTISEDVADLGGVEIAFQAYTNKLKKDGFNGDQLRLQQQRFFRAYAEYNRTKYSPAYVKYVALGEGNSRGADEHSLNKERVNGIVSNIDGWYEAFDVKDGNLYRKPEERVHIW